MALHGNEHKVHNDVMMLVHMGAYFRMQVCHHPGRHHMKMSFGTSI
eukprot:COSAG02_NODE_45085_length_360_cov_0.904215_1_plen_46_part_00